jgi:hypothetical protein
MKKFPIVFQTVCAVALLFLLIYAKAEDFNGSRILAFIFGFTAAGAFYPFFNFLGLTDSICFSD